MAPASNRRQRTRHLTCAPAGVASPEKSRLALIRDASATGALLYSKSQFPVDTPLKITIRLENEKEVLVDARVIRIERLHDDFWNFGIGVVFTPAREDLTRTFSLMAVKQEALFGKPKGKQ